MIDSTCWPEKVFDSGELGVLKSREKIDDAEGVLELRDSYTNLNSD